MTVPVGGDIGDEVRPSPPPPPLWSPQRMRSDRRTESQQLMTCRNAGPHRRPGAHLHLRDRQSHHRGPRAGHQSRRPGGRAGGDAASVREHRPHAAGERPPLCPPPPPLPASAAALHCPMPRSLLPRLHLRPCSTSPSPRASSDWAPLSRSPITSASPSLADDALAQNRSSTRSTPLQNTTRRQCTRRKRRATRKRRTARMRRRRGRTSPRRRTRKLGWFGPMGNTRLIEILIGGNEGAVMHESHLLAL